MSELIDNRSQRVRTLKEIIQDLHRGVPADEVKQRLKTLVRQTDSTEIAAMEQSLIADGMPVGEIQRMCDTHAQVLHEIAAEQVTIAVEPGHPIDTFRRENEALQAVVDRLGPTLHRLAGAATLPEPVADELRAGLAELMDVDKHYQRKENLLFSCLERHGIDGPSRVMWAKDDEVRQLLRAAEEALSADPLDPNAVSGRLAAAAHSLAQMIVKEQRVLLPLAYQTLTAEQWGEIWLQSPDYGWCLVEPREGYRPPPATAPAKAAAVASDAALAFPTGHLTPEQLRGLLGALPVDLTFVDAEDRVRYFSEGPQRIFARSKAILGRKVHHCHPPKSVHVVEQILADFKAGRQSVAEFWIELRGRFVHIRYFAVRDERGAYLGTLEVTQDLTPLRALQGEQRLLGWSAGSR